MKLLATVIAAALSTSACAQPQAKQVVSNTWFGCAERDHFSEAIQLAHDEKADDFSRVLGARLLTGGCVILKEDEAVFITELSMYDGLIKIHRRGNLAEFWTAIEAVGY